MSNVDNYFDQAGSDGNNEFNIYGNVDMNGRVLSADEFRKKVIGLDNTISVNSVDDLPTPINNVITLEDEVNYAFDSDVGIGENRIQAGVRNTIFGRSPETSFLNNTLDGEPLLTANETTSLWRITLYTSGVGASNIYLDGSTSTQNDVALDWQFVNFSGGDVGTIKDYGNAIFNTIGFIDKSADGFPAFGDGLIFDGIIGTIGFTDSIFTISGAGKTAIKVPATATLTRRIRLSECAVVALDGAVGIDVSEIATIPNEGFVLNDINFAGNGTYLGGLDYTSDIARFEGCRGITNTYAAAYLSMQGNVTATVIDVQGDPEKVAGATTPSTINQKFDHSDGRLTYTGSLTRAFKVDVNCSLSSGNNDNIGLYISQNGTVIPETELYDTTDAGGALSNVSIQGIVLLETGDYIEPYVENDSSTVNITVSDLSMSCITI